MSSGMAAVTSQPMAKPNMPGMMPPIGPAMRLCRYITAIAANVATIVWKTMILFIRITVPQARITRQEEYVGNIERPQAQGPPKGNVGPMAVLGSSPRRRLGAGWVSVAVNRGRGMACRQEPVDNRYNEGGRHRLGGSPVSSWQTRKIR